MFTELDPSLEYTVIPINEYSTYYYIKKDEYTLNDKCLVIDKTKYTDTRNFYKNGDRVLAEKQETTLFTRTIYSKNIPLITYLYRKDANGDYQLVRVYDKLTTFDYSISTGFLTKTVIKSKGSVETQINYANGIVSYIDITDDNNSIYKTFRFKDNKLDHYEYAERICDETIKVEYTAHNNNLYVALLDDRDNVICDAINEDGFFKTKDELIFFMFSHNLPRDIEYHHLMIDSNDKLYFGDLYHEI